MGVKNCHVIGLVGEGSFGKVYEGRHKFTGQGELFEILEDDKHLPEEQVQAIAKQLVRALHYLHSNRVIHCDMKPQHILIGAGSIVKDPVKYPDNMSSSFKLKGLLNKVPQNRLTWPALLEHPFVKETTEEVEARETRSSTAAERGCVAAWRGERYKIQTSGGLAVSSPEDNSGISFQDDAQSNIPDSKAVNSSPNEEFPGFANEVKQSGCQLLDRLENNSRTVKGAKIIGQDNEALAHLLLPIKRCLQGSQNSSRDQDILTSNQSLRIISNLVAAGAITSSGLLDEIVHDILGYTTFIVSIKSSELNELRAKVGAPGFILCCLEYLELKDLGRPVALLAKIIGQRPLAVQLVGKGLLDHSSLKEVIVDVPIVSDLARMDKAFCFKKGTTIGALLYKEGIVGLLDSRATFVNPSTKKEQLRTAFKLFTISSKSNLFFLLCGDQDKCFCLAGILVSVVKFHERNGDLVTIDDLAITAQMQLKQIFRLASPEERKSEFGGILIGWRADKNYQAYSIMSEEQEVKEMESLSDIKDLEGLREVQEKLVAGSGSSFANEIYDRLHGVNCEMSEELAKAAAVKMVHCSALSDVYTGDTTYVCIFRHQQNFNPDLSVERHEPLDVQLNEPIFLKHRLILVKIPIAGAGIYMDFESSMSARENVQCASLMLSKKQMNYYRILCGAPSHVQDLFAELTQNSVQSVGPFVPCKYHLGLVYIDLSVALFTVDALRSIAQECRDDLER